MLKLSRYLGSEVSKLLEVAPFNTLRFEKSYEDELDTPIFHFVFPESGLELRCDQDEKISVIFLFLDKLCSQCREWIDIPSDQTRSEIRRSLGKPSKTCEASTHPVLGSIRAWDRFLVDEFAVRFEYEADTERIKKITLIRGDVIPH